MKRITASGGKVGRIKAGEVIEVCFLAYQVKLLVFCLNYWNKFFNNLVFVGLSGGMNHPAYLSEF